MSVSQEVENFMQHRLTELTGIQNQATLKEPVDYDAMSREHGKLAKEVDQLEKRLRKRKVFDDLSKLAVSLGVTPKDLSRLDEAEPKLLSRWTGATGDALQFISLLRSVRARNELERRMTEAINSGEGKTAGTIN